MRILLLVIGLWASVGNSAPPAECKKWFEESRIVPGEPECEIKCGTLATGMDSFMCPQACSELCKANQSSIEKMLGRLLYYPGLTVEERRLVQESPMEALQVFKQKGRAEAATARVFGRDAQNDESDAFRHFMWAGLLSMELGSDIAKKFLDAHESGERPDSAARAMDLANNRAGLLTAENLRKRQKISEGELEKEALFSLKNGTLVILESRGGALK